MSFAAAVRGPEVLDTTIDGQQVFISLRVPPDLGWFEGHFPAEPLLPAVVQTDWAISLCRQHFQLAPRFAGLGNVKFMRLVFPGLKLTLRLGPASGRTEIPFAYFDGAAEVACGRLKFRE